MNLFFKSYKFYLFFLIFITFKTLFISAKEQESTDYLAPRIQHYKHLLYHPDVPNISFFRDETGTLYIGKESGLNIINGSSNIFLPLKGSVFVTENGSDTVFYACEDDVGYLKFNPDEGIEPVSIISNFPVFFREFSPVQFTGFKNHLFINSEEAVFRIDGHRVKRYSFNRLPVRLFPADSSLFLFVPDSGIYRLINEDFELLVPLELINREKVISINMIKDVMHIMTSDGKIYLMNGNGTPLKMTGTISTGSTITGAVKINDNMLMVTTSGKGIFIVDAGGSILNALGNKNGLPSGNFRDIVHDELGGTWVLSEFGLHKIDYPSGMYTADIPEDLGSIMASARIGNIFYFGTQSGLFEMDMDLNGSDKYIRKRIIPADSGSFHLLANSGEVLFAAGSNCLYELSEGAMVRMDAGFFSSLYPLSESILLTSGNEGVISFEKDGRVWQKRILDPGIIYGHSFERCGEVIYFLSSGNHLNRINNDLSKVETVQFDPVENFYKLRKFNGDLYLVGQSNVFKINPEGIDQNFQPDPDLLNLFLPDLLCLDDQGTYWFIYHESHNVAHLSAFRDIRDFNMTAVLPAMEQLGIISALDIDNHFLWLSGEKSLMRIDRSLIGDTAFSDAIIRFESIINDSRGILRFGRYNGHAGAIGEQDGIFNIPYEHNQLEFHLTQLEYQTDIPILYRYRLLPVNGIWTEWSKASSYIVVNLREGKYTIEAQSKDLYGNLSHPILFKFSVSPPFYRTWYAFIIYLLVLITLVFVVYKWRLLNLRKVELRVSERIQSQLEDLSKQKEQSDRLIAEILPKTTADQLKEKGKAKWDKYEMATVLFSDIQGFTRIAEEMNPEVLIDELDKFFFHFDSVVEKYNIEKIKTIGDAYMAAGGIPEKNSTNPVEVVLAALEMQDYMHNLKKTKTDIWDLRIGIHSGPVIAGVVGHKKVSYDIWGDTVNTASRMESSGMPGKVNISGITHALVKEYFICEYRGKLPVKYKGNIDMYFVNGLRPELSIDLKGLPNRRFFLKLQFLRLNDLAQIVFENILTELPETLLFQNLQYAKKVFNQVFFICRSEEVDEEDTLIARTAALLCFTGLTQTYVNFENRSVVIARDLLPRFRYSEKQIDQITNLILATKQPFNPVNTLEKVLIDAKMEYVGRPDFISSFKLLLVEMKENDPNISVQDWKKKQISFIKEFQFYTIAGKRLREISAEEQIELIESEEWI